MAPEVAVAASPNRSGVGRWSKWLRGYLPEGRGLPELEWRVRHNFVVGFVIVHAVALALYGMATRWAPAMVLAETGLIAGVGVLASLPTLGRKARSGLAALGCTFASAVLVQFSGGLIEAHFHFFVVVALISLYQDWLPFLLTIAFVALDHGVLGTIEPTWVYNHHAAHVNPWLWAGIHATFVLAECCALLVVWRTNEDARTETDRVLHSVGEGLFGVDANCMITFANPAATRLSGIPKEQLLGKPLYSILLGADGRPAFPPDILRRTPGSFTAEAILAQPPAPGDSGERPPLPVEVLCTPFEGRSHQEGAVVAMRDITDRRRSEEARVTATHQQHELDRLREVNSFKTRFMNMAAHELNTPLTPIKVQMHLLKARTGTGTEPERKSVHLLDRNFQRLYGLVQDLLDSTRLQGDRLPVRPVPADAAPLVREVADSFATAAQQAGVHFSSDCASSLPCRIDPPRLAQALSNLLVNALKFTPAGGDVVLKAKVEDGMVRIQIQDSGVGMTADQIGRLFQPFEQVHEGQVAGNPGSGLGLYITRGIVEMHQGRVYAESDGPGRGARFVIDLPVADLTAEPAAPAQPPVNPAAALAAGAVPSVLHAKSVLGLGLPSSPAKAPAAAKGAPAPAAAGPNGPADVLAYQRGSASPNGFGPKGLPPPEDGAQPPDAAPPSPP